jgi:fructuronate reductase
MTDTSRARLAEIARTSRSGTDMAQRVIGELQLFGQDLATRASFISRVGEFVDTIVRHGVAAAISEALDASITQTSADRALTPPPAL